MKTQRDRKSGKPFTPVYRYDGTLLGHMPAEDVMSGSLTLAKNEMSRFLSKKTPGDIAFKTIKVDIVFGMQSPRVGVVNNENYDILFDYEHFIPSEWFYGYMEGKGRRL